MDLMHPYLLLVHPYLLLVATFIFGTIIGSFANVFVLRYGTGRSLSGRSSCGSCGKRLSWYELIPVVSWVIQRGRCRFCESRISPQYLIVELLFGAVFVGCLFGSLLAGTPGSFDDGLIWFFHLTYLWVLSFLLLSLSIYDVRHMIIPDGMLIALGVAVLLWNTVNLWGDWRAIMMMLIAGPLVALPFFILWFVSNGRWMGFGDIKLSVALGWMLGLLGGFSALIFGVWAGAIISLAIIGITRLVSRRTGLTMKSEIPFGPFLVAGALLVLLTDITMLTVMELM